MNWQDIIVSEDNTHFLFDGEQLFNTPFLEVLKFHSPGLAPVKDETGSYHIDVEGKQLYKERYSRTFGFYCNRAAVAAENNCFHITHEGDKAYLNSFAWTGNFQENICTVRNGDNEYFHIDINGNKIYENSFRYCGDFKDGIACVKTMNGFYKHIDTKGNFINDKAFSDLGVFHKNYATAKDINGWYHIDKNGIELYPQRYSAIEPFYNGYALVTKSDNKKVIIDEQGKKIMSL